MAWKKVLRYSFGFSRAPKKFWLNYTLHGSTNVTTQIMLTATQFSAVAQLFNSATRIDYQTTGKYFLSFPRTL